MGANYRVLRGGGEGVQKASDPRFSHFVAPAFGMISNGGCPLLSLIFCVMGIQIVLKYFSTCGPPEMTEMKTLSDCKGGFGFWVQQVHGIELVS